MILAPAGMGLGGMGPALVGDIRPWIFGANTPRYSCGMGSV